MAIAKVKEEILKKMRFPLFTAWHGILLQYKMAYEFVKKKGLLKEFQEWCKTEGMELVKTFHEEALKELEKIKKQTT